MSETDEYDYVAEMDRTDDFEWVRHALRRLNPRFHEKSWPALNRIEAELKRLREENKFLRTALDAARIEAQAEKQFRAALEEKA